MSDPNVKKFDLEPDDDIKEMVEGLDKTDPKAEFYTLFSKWNKVIKYTPLPILKAWNKFLYKYDEPLYKLENWWDGFYDKYFHWHRRLGWWYRDNVAGIFRHRIPQMWAYAKLGWDDWDWDYSYFLHLMEWKLKRMEKCIRGYDRHTSTQDSCDQMKLVIECLERINNSKLGARDPYTDALYKELEELYPEYEKSNSIEKLFSKDDESERRKVWLSKAGKKHVVYESRSLFGEEPEGYREDFRRLNNYYEAAKTADLRVAFHIMLPQTLTEKQFDNIMNYNKKIYEEYGYNNEELTKDKVINIHHGLYSWWD